MIEKNQEEKQVEKTCYICGEIFLEPEWCDKFGLSFKTCPSCTEGCNHRRFFVDTLGLDENEGIYIDLKTGKRYYLKTERKKSQKPLVQTKLVERRELRPNEYTLESRLKKINEDKQGNKADKDYVERLSLVYADLKK